MLICHFGNSQGETSIFSSISVAQRLKTTILSRTGVKQCLETTDFSGMTLWSGVRKALRGVLAASRWWLLTATPGESGLLCSMCLNPTRHVPSMSWVPALVTIKGERCLAQQFLCNMLVSRDCEQFKCAHPLFSQYFYF